MSVPSSILPPWGRSETDAWIGTARPALLERLARAEDRRLDLEDVLRGLDDEQVDAALDEPEGLLGEDLDELAEGDPAERRVVGGGEVAGRTDRAGDEAVLAGGLARDLGRLAVDLERVVGQPPLVELQPAGLEGVGLDDLGARLDHRGMDALDDVRAVQDQRLVALARQSAVVLGGQVELLQRGAHAAVEDDDTAANGLEVVAHGRAMLPTKTPTLTKAWQRCAGQAEPGPAGWDGGVTPPREDGATPGRDRGWG